MKLKGLLILLTFLAFNCTREDKTNIPLSAYVASDAIAAVQINNLSALRDSLGTNEFISRLENLGPYNSIYD